VINKALFASLLLFSTLGGMKKVPECRDKDFEAIRTQIRELNRFEAILRLRRDIKKQILESEENMKKFFKEEIKRRINKDKDEHNI